MENKAIHHTLLSWSEYQKQLSKTAKDHYLLKDLDLIKKAFDYASTIHQNQKRFSGEPYIHHPATVSLNTASLQLDAETVAAALLHDTAEDGGTLKAIKKNFGDEIAFLVKGVTKVNKIKYHGAERSAESMRRMFLAIAGDIRIVIVKLIDRLHNMETLWALPSPQKRMRIAMETLEIYAPLADRLGMGEIKDELEDLAFHYVYPQEFKWVKKEISRRIPLREQYLTHVIPLVSKELAREDIQPIEISARAKHLYSTWKKLLRKDMDWERILDLVAVRVVVDDIENCYAALGLVHALWPPMPGRIKDYIALPKPNGYQSLHTTVFCLNGKPTEFQIRTKAMHKEAEYGIAAHWFWNEKGKPKNSGKAHETKFSWVNQLQTWQKEFRKNKNSSEEFLESLKIDFFKDRIFVLTPEGDVIDLPEGSTPIDFAYHIHSEIGDRAVGAKVNSKLVSFHYQLASGEVVEILTQKNKKPNAEWLSFVKTSIARSRIRSAVSKESETPAETKEIEFEITVQDRVGLLKDISGVFSAFRLNIVTAAVTRNQDVYPSIAIRFREKKTGQLEKIKTRLKKIRGVESISEKIK